MSTKYKDYPIYTYDEPATYNDFSGGINTDPSNEHLEKNEMRDCLNMHYSSAALVKRKGASLLCNIECPDELFNIQGVFLFTYRTTYLIIAADGKLYKGFYSPNATIKLSRLPISASVAESLDAYNPLDFTVGLEERIDESINEQHDGFVYVYTINSQGKRVSLSEDYIGEYSKLKDGTVINIGDIVEYNGIKYERLSDTYTLERILPTNEAYWITLDAYNTKYAEQIKTKTDPLSVSYKWITNINNGLVLDSITNTWRLSGTYNEKNQWIPNGSPGLWKERYNSWDYTDAVKYKDEIYICIKPHMNYSDAPETSIYWTKVVEKKELVFQNYKSIEAATYKNKMYIATGTRFVQIELVNNELKAFIVEPYSCNTEEITNIGYNYLSPYPELCRSTRYNQAITSIGGLLAIKNIYGRYTLIPQMNFANSENEEDYYFRWEKKIGNDWYVLYSYEDNLYQLNNNTESIKQNLFTIEVDDADKYQYRCSFAKSFERPDDLATEWNYNKSYKIDDRISVSGIDSNSTKIYRCVKAHTPSKVLWDNISYKESDVKESITKPGYFYKEYLKDSNGNYVINTVLPIFSATTSTRSGNSLYEKQDDGTYKFICYDTSTIIKGDTYWEEEFTEEPILRLDNSKRKFDWIVDEVDGEYFGSATSVLATNLKPEDTFNIIQSCRKIISDGNKFLLYGDKYNSGSWYKTIIDNPGYITQRGSLSFKTNKNEELIKVIPFNGNIIAFANAENVGGSIHLVTGNGDDYDANDGYYSPYRRSTINSSISCDNANTVQVCENIIVFKYFDTLYYISGSELTNEVVSVYSCNDRIKHNNNFVQIPWEDNSCISEVTEDYYALLWKEKYTIDNGDLVLERPAMRVKMYYKIAHEIGNKYYYPWLRDESEYFNVDHIVYIKGKPVYLYNNTLTTFNNEVYTDYNKNYKCLVHFRAEDLNYPKMYKLISNVLIYYHRNQYSKIDFNMIVKNEAGHILLDNSVKRFSIQDLRALKAGDKLIDGEMRLDSTILDSKVFNTDYKFPCLLADTIITAENNKEFSVSSITYNYTATDTPDTTAYDMYADILRPKEVR